MPVKIQNELTARVTVDEEDVVFTLRQPTNKELNQFLSDRYEIGKKNRMKDTSLDARIGFFDKLLIKVENLVDANNVAITPERKDEIPANWKGGVIFNLFEDQDISIKN
jgi:hypothetical protein